MPFRDALTIRNSIIASLDARGSQIRTEAGEPIMDLVDAVSLESERLNIIAEYIRRISTIPGWRSLLADQAFKTKLADTLNVSSTSLTDDLARRLGVPADLPNDVEAILYVDLSNFASSYGRDRRAATFATGTERLYLPDNSPYSLARGATVRTSTSNPVFYDTSVDLVGSVPAFDPEKNAYYVDVSLTCRTAGSIGNQVRGAINAVVGAIPNVTSVVNLDPTQDGLEYESNNDLLSALDGVLGGASINTLQGLKNFVMNNGAVDVAVVGSGHSLMKRSTAGAVDIYIIGSILLTQQVNIVVEAEGDTVLLPYQPVRSLGAVVDITGARELASGTGYDYNEDTGEFKGSAQANGSLTWLVSSGGGPLPGDVIQVTYVTNSLIRKLQQYFDVAPDTEVPGSSILVKEATQVNIVFEMMVVALPEVSQQQAELAVQDTVNQFLSSYIQGKMLDYSDVLVVAAQATDANGALLVDRIDGFKMAVKDNLLGTESISVLENEYVRLYSINFIAP